MYFIDNFKVQINRFMQIVYFIRDRFRWQEIATFSSKNKISNNK